MTQNPKSKLYSQTPPVTHDLDKPLPPVQSDNLNSDESAPMGTKRLSEMSDIPEQK